MSDRRDNKPWQVAEKFRREWPVIGLYAVFGALAIACAKGWL
jgi:hypothetical protein